MKTNKVMSGLELLHKAIGKAFVRKPILSELKPLNPKLYERDEQKKGRKETKEGR